MATYNQIYNLVNTVTTEAIGGTAITAQDTQSLVALGEQIFSTQANTDAFYKTLPDVIGRTWARYMELARDDRGIQRTPLDFGIILQKISVETIARAEQNTSWGDQSNPFAKAKDTTDIKSNLFSVIGGFEIDKIVYDIQLRTAFKSAENMGAFINLVYQDMRNGMILALNETDRLAECTAIAECLSNGDGITKVNLLADYNTLTNAGLTIDSCRRNVDFIRYAVKTIKETIQLAHEPSTLYNSRGAERWLSDDNQRLHVLNRFANDVAFYLTADTYHKEIVELSGYKGVNCWQGLGEKADFADCSSVKIQNGEINVSQTGVVAFCFDYEKIGTMIERIRTKSMYNPKSECSNYYHKADIGYFVDNGEIGIVFYLAEE